MYETLISFSKEVIPEADFFMDSNTLYDEEKGYGFVIERNRKEYEYLQIAEVNSAFSVWYWDEGKEITKLIDTPLGVSVDGNELVPLIFKLKVPFQGNYQVVLTMSADAFGCDNIYVFTGRRRLAAKGVSILPNSNITLHLNVNVCDIIPRGLENRYEDKTIDITLLGNHVSITALTVKEVKTPTIYITGDSTVTDQKGNYPYNPGCCFAGWGQMLSAFLNPDIAISNHAHSGLTTKSFREEGHYDIVQSYMKTGDYLLIQFGHNDQKLPELKASDGYRKRLMQYIDEAEKIGAFPIMITPLARNTWKADGTYNDLLAEYAEECIRIGKERQIPVIDLHGFSMDFIMGEGLENAKQYFYPKDYTHTNDYGAYVMARYIVSEFAQMDILKTYVKKNSLVDWKPTTTIVLPKRPEGFEMIASKLPDESNLERPDDLIIRVEFIDLLIKAVGFVPMNVYNDMYLDVIGHEWYAGVVEASYLNSLVNDKYTSEGRFRPLEPVSSEQMVSFVANGYRSRKITSFKVHDTTLLRQLHIVDDNYQATKLITRREALRVLKKLENVL